MRSSVSADSAHPVDRDRGREDGPHSANAWAIASARAVGSPGATRRLDPSSAISGIPPTRLATNGVPQANDSRSMLGDPSDRLGKTVWPASADVVTGGAVLGEPVVAEVKDGGGFLSLVQGQVLA